MFEGIRVSNGAVFVIVTGAVFSVFGFACAVIKVAGFFAQHVRWVH